MVEQAPPRRLDRHLASVDCCNAAARRVRTPAGTHALISLGAVTIIVTMKSVSVSELKAHLSKYLREIRRGGEVQVMDRGVPVARLAPVPPVGGHDEANRQRLIEAGVLRTGRGGTAAVLETPPLELPTSLADALDEERADRL